MIKTKDENDEEGEEVHCFWLTDDDKRPIDVLAKSKNIEFRHSADPFSWIEWVMTNQLAYKLDGVITDDGAEFEQEPDIEKFKTYREYRMNAYTRKKILGLFEKMRLNRSIKEMVNYYGDIFADEED